VRYLTLALSALADAARALAPAGRRRRAARERRYITPHISQPPRPSVATGPIPVILPSARTGRPAPALPLRPDVPWEASGPVVDLDVARRAKVRRLAVGQPGRHVRTARVLTSQHVGMIRLLAIAHQDAETRGAAA
jgi:hypothetical protein